jgi:hypothetical protein
VFEIGSSLREARLRQHLEYTDVELRTKIRARYVRALEDEEFESLPAQTYVRGFLRTYAEFLGLDGQLYVDEYNSRFAGDDHVAGVRRSYPPQPRQHKRLETSVVVLALAAIALVTALVIAAWRFGGGSSAQTSIPNLAPSRRHARVAARSERRLHPAAARRPLARLLVAAVRGNSLLEVHAGSARGRLLYHGTLQRGQRQRFVAARLWLNVGAPEALALVLNGRRVPLLGGRPRVLVVTPRAVRPGEAA